MLRACIALVALGAAAGAASAAPPPASAFGRLPQIQTAAISPDGRRLAILGGTADHRILSIAPIDGAQAKTIDFGDAQVLTVRWAGNDYVLVRSSTYDTMKDASAGGAFAYHLDRDFVVTSDGVVKGALLRHKGESDFATALPIWHVIDAPQPTAIVQGLTEASGIAPTDPDTRLSSKAKSPITPALWRVDVATLSAQIIDKGPTSTDRWDVDSQGRARVRIESDDKGYRILGRASDQAPWKTIVESKDPDNAPGYLGYEEATQSILVVDEGDGGQTRTHRYSLSDGTRSDVADPVRGEVGLITDPYTRAPLAVCGEWERPECRWSDPQLGALADKLSRALAGSVIRFRGWAKDRSMLIVEAEAPDIPPAWYLLDSVHGQLSPIGDGYPELKGAAIGKVSWFTYKARDGLEIPAYLTLPPGASSTARLPLVVLPHGGPAARDDYHFDWWAQFLATRGYAVLQPQFRGSGGFGAAFERSGHREWGGKMQTDLLDGIADLAAKGTIDPQRVCIVGASFGGYAALAGASLHPEAYRCAASVNGVSDLSAFMGERAHNYGEDSVGYWKRLIGKDGADTALIAASSPARQAGRVRGPVLLVVSAEDTTVAPEQSRIMAHALDDAGRSAQLVTLKGDDHYLSNSATRTQMLEAIDAFLAKNLPVGP
jgi:dipeptidyl aminopeptidase/acylaminoacyl peptidase